MKLIEKSDGKWFLSVGDTDREIGYNRENNVTTIEIQTDITGYEFFLDFGFPDSTIASRILTKRDGLLSATLSAEYLSVDGTVCLQVKGVDTNGSIKKSNIIIVEVVKSVDETDPQQPPVYIWAQYINQVTELRDAAIEANKHGPRINMVNGHWEVYNAIEGKYEDTGIDARGGSGVPAGGSTHQVLAKKSDDDFDFEWIEVAVDVPTKTSDLINDSGFVSDEDYVHTDNNYSDTDKSKLDSLENYDDTTIKGRISVVESNTQTHISNTNIHVTENEKAKIQEIDNKANSNDVYTKIQTDNMLNDKEDTLSAYTEAEIDTLVDGGWAE